MESFQLLAGASVVDITPPLEVGLLTSSVRGEYGAFESVRLPLKARVLVLRSVHEMVALVSMDLLALNDTSVGGWEQFKKGMSDVIDADRIILTCTHTHNAPESVALSGLYLTEAYRSWLAHVQGAIREGIGRAIDVTRPCTVELATGVLNGHSLQRRILTANGVVMSDSVQPVTDELMNRGPVDRRVRTIRLKGLSGDSIATVVHAICHPVHEMCMPYISADFPGEMCRVLEELDDNGIPFFLNGAAGDINPPTVSLGPEYARRHGRALARVAAMRGGAAVDMTGFRFAHQELQLSIRPEAKVSNKLDGLARLSGIRIGQLAILFLPGEPFVDIALAIERSSPFEDTIVVGFGENNIGYIPTEAAFSQGGYEVGPGKWSFLEKGTDDALYLAGIKLLEALI